MQNKGLVIVLTIVISALCLFYLSFTFVSQGIQKDAIQYATDKNGSVNLGQKTKLPRLTVEQTDLRFILERVHLQRSERK